MIETKREPRCPAWTPVLASISKPYPLMDDVDREATWSVGAAVGAALAASACCVVPFALISLGVGGAWIGYLTALAPYQPIFAALALGAIGYAGYREYRRTQRPACDCNPVVSAATRRTLLGVGTAATVGLLVSSWVVAGSPFAATQGAVVEEPPTEQTDASQTPLPATAERVVLDVEGMTCATCAPSVERALERVEGVYDAQVSYTDAQAIVLYDPEKSNPAALTEATASVGYPSSHASSE